MGYRALFLGQRFAERRHDRLALRLRGRVRVRRYRVGDQRLLGDLFKHLSGRDPANFVTRQHLTNQQLFGNPQQLAFLLSN